MFLAKDGTNRGGARIGSGQKKKPLHDKILDGNPGKRPLTIMEFKNTADLEGEVELLTSPLELADYKSAITEAMFRGTKRNIESEDDGSKNTTAE